MNYTIQDGFPADKGADAARLFWDAFKAKLHPVMRPQAKALAFFTLIADPNHAIGAYTADGTLIGLAGFATHKGSLMGGSLRQMQSVYGPFGGTWRGLILSVLDRPQAKDVLLMDGIFVHADARGQGVGTALIGAIIDKARVLDCTRVRLDVINTNPRARALYERHGFVAQKTSNIGMFSLVFGFRKSTTMLYTLDT